VIKSEIKLLPEKTVDRMNYFHVCECGISFEGFKEQTACWTCISDYMRHAFNWI
jgi:hypothetical protein